MKIFFSTSPPIFLGPFILTRAQHPPGPVAPSSVTIRRTPPPFAPHTPLHVDPSAGLSSTRRPEAHIYGGSALLLLRRNGGRFVLFKELSRIAFQLMKFFKQIKITDNIYIIFGHTFSSHAWIDYFPFSILNVQSSPILD